MHLTLMGTGAMSILAIVLTRMLDSKSCVCAGTFGEHEKRVASLTAGRRMGGTADGVVAELDA